MVRQAVRLSFGREEAAALPLVERESKRRWDGARLLIELEPVSRMTRLAKKGIAIRAKEAHRPCKLD